MTAKPKFAITPDNDQLAALDREFGFAPLGVEHPRRLSTQQVTAFNQDGYLKNLRVFDDDEAAAQRAYFDDLLARVTAAGGDSYSISTAHLSYGPVYDLLTHPAIVDVVADLLGANVVGWGSHYFCKQPGDGRQVAWHQDATYWPLSKSRTVTVWLAIDDADRENACMQFLPGSHLEGLIPYRESESAEGNVLTQTVENVERFGEPVLVEMRAGEMSIHSDLLLHGSEANNSNRRRCGLTLRYCPTEVRAHMGWDAKGVVVRGEDAAGNWANPPRPAQA